MGNSKNNNKKNATRWAKAETVCGILSLTPILTGGGCV